MPKTNVNIVSANVPQLAAVERSSRKRLVIQNLSPAQIAIDDDPAVSLNSASANVGIILGPWDGVNTPPTLILDEYNAGSLVAAWYVTASLAGARVLIRDFA